LPTTPPKASAWANGIYDPDEPCPANVDPRWWPQRRTLMRLPARPPDLLVNFEPTPLIKTY